MRRRARPGYPLPWNGAARGTGQEAKRGGVREVGNARRAPPRLGGGRTMSSTMRILVALADPADRAAVREAVRGVDGFDILAYAGTGTEAVQLNVTARPDVVLLAADLAELDGYPAAAMISRHS